MTDRELLEAAARAYWGDEVDDVMSFRWDESEQSLVFTHADNQDHNGADVELLWLPLTEDGDAFRLAVKLGIAIYPPECNDDDPTASVPDGPWITEPRGSDPLAATRRAITRAAAAMAGDTPANGTGEAA